VADLAGPLGLREHGQRRLQHPALAVAFARSSW
jgi:hypothetical protein